MSDEKSTPSTPSKATARDQGVPEVYLGEAGNFEPGRDASLKRDLVHAIVSPEVGGYKNPNCMNVFEVEEAERLIEARGWEGFVATKRRIFAEKAEKTEAAAVRREEKKAETAARKEAEAAEQVATKARLAAEQSDDGDEGESDDSDPED